jgi:hypothetical protein
VKYLSSAFKVLCILLLAEGAMAQDLDPRAYVRAPVNMNFVGAGFSYSDGDVVTDASLPLKNVKATLKATSLAVGHTFSMFRQTAQASVSLPYAWANASGTIGGGEKTASRTGLCDMRLRCSMLFLGAPAATRDELKNASRRTVLGTSLTISAPTGQYYPEKLINLGTHRWAVKPELALSQPFGKRGLFDLYAGVWLFTKNDSYYTGNFTRAQDPMGSFQTHISYNINPGFWAAFDFTYYTGGQSTVNGVEMNDRQDNSRFGGTMVIPVGKLSSLKFAYSTGAVIRNGADFTTVSVGWQMVFFGKSQKTEPKS